MLGTQFTSSKLRLPREWAGSGWFGRRAVAAGGDRPGGAAGGGDGASCRAVGCSLSGRGYRCDGGLLSNKKFKLFHISRSWIRIKD